MVQLRDRKARYQLIILPHNRFIPTIWIRFSIPYFLRFSMFVLPSPSFPTFSLSPTWYISLFFSLNYISIFVYLSLSLFSFCSHATKASPTVLDNETVSRFVSLSLGTGAGEWKRLRKSERERMLHEYRRGETRRERKYELSLGTHREYSLSTRRRMTADHEARTIKPFCRKTPVITSHQPFRRSTDRLLHRFSFRARFFSSLVFHSRLFRCSRFPHSNSLRWFSLTLSLPFTFSTILLRSVFFNFFLTLSFEYWIYK